MSSTISDLRVEPITEEQDIISANDVICATFGAQVHDGIWTRMNPGWETPEGKAGAAKRLLKRWSATRDNKGNLTTIFLKATVPDPERAGERKLVGVTIWLQSSPIEGYGNVPYEDLRTVMDLEELYPGNKPMQNLLCQLDRSLHKRRIQVIKEKATASPPAVFVLDLCVVDPAFQGKGIAKKMVQWGLDEAKQRGGLEAITEASSMGRHAYIKLGFKPDEADMVYEVDPEFKDYDFSPNLFMRTQGP